MNAEPKIGDLKKTQVDHGLERLTHFGLRSGVWNRLRFDDDFAKKVCQWLIDQNKMIPGEEFIAEFARTMTRLEMNELLQDQNVNCLRDDIIMELLPATIDMAQPDLLSRPSSFEWFIVEPGYAMDEDAARQELDRRDLVPANTEDGLSFMLSEHRSKLREKSLSVLDAWIIRSEKKFLTLAYTMSGIPMICLSDVGGITRRFLAKRKPPQQLETLDGN